METVWIKGNEIENKTAKNEGCMCLVVHENVYGNNFFFCISFVKLITKAL